VLETAIEEGWPPIAVFTHRGGSDLDAISVQSVAERHNIPTSCRHPNKPVGLGQLTEIAPDIIFTVNYRFILSPEAMAQARQHRFNIHGSLLPILRGRAPLTWAIILGHKETGVTVHKMAEIVDEGDIVAQVRIPITSTDTSRTIQAHMLECYPELVRETIHKAHSQNINYTQQDSSKATYGERRTPEDGRIDWSWTARQIYDWVRALTRPYPGAFTTFEGERIIVWDVCAIPDVEHDSAPGTILRRYRNLQSCDS